MCIYALIAVLSDISRILLALPLRYAGVLPTWRTCFPCYIISCASTTSASSAVGGRGLLSIRLPCGLFKFHMSVMVLLIFCTTGSRRVFAACSSACHLIYIYSGSIPNSVVRSILGVRLYAPIVLRRLSFYIFSRLFRRLGAGFPPSGVAHTGAPYVIVGLITAVYSSLTLGTGGPR
jgi:hypothetical protein